MMHTDLEEGEQKKKGSGCSASGNAYEQRVHAITTQCVYNSESEHAGKRFNTQEALELAGSSSRNDVECNCQGEKDVGLELKTKTVDCMQCVLKWDRELGRWVGSPNNKIPELSKEIFIEAVSKMTLFNGNVPPFMLRDMEYDEWLKIKRETTDFNDVYVDCPSDTIKRLYSAKGCSYMQILNKGLYHLGNDVCGFQVPEFLCEQQFRIRIKVHSRKNNKGVCKLSVTMSCQPKNIKDLAKSEFSLDDPKTLPRNLDYSGSSSSSSSSSSK
jgi:hypothetical protein